MRFAFDDDQRLLAQVARDVMGRACPASAVCAAWENPTGRVPGLWRALGEAGLLGAAAREEVGGLGLTALDLVLPFEESGRVALPEPFVETAAVAVPLLDAAAAGGDGVAAGWLDGLVSGSRAASLSLPGTPYALHAGSAELILAERSGRLVALPAAEVGRTAVASIDGSRRLAALALPERGGIDLGGAEALDEALDRAALATAAQLLGLAERMVAMAVDYAVTRTQFGRAIGSYQAVQHRLADAHAGVEMARPLVYRAAHTLATGGTARWLHVSMAKAQAGEAAIAASQAALQIHGAIGYTIEYDLHLWMKRAWALAAAWGDARWHRNRIADALLGEAPSLAPWSEDV